MMHENIDVLRGEFIGKWVSVPEKGIEGKIIDETKNSFLVKTKDARKRVLKSGSLFKIRINSNLVEIDGKSVVMKPEDRIRIKPKWK